MQDAWQEMGAGWKEARWSLYFGLILFPLAILACFVSYGVEGRVFTPPSALTWGLIALATMVSLFLAGLWDGPDGKLGRAVLFMVLAVFAILLLRHLARKSQREQQATLRLAGRRYRVRLLQGKLGWKDVRRARLQNRKEQEVQMSFQHFRVHT